MGNWVFPCRPEPRGSAARPDIRKVWSDRLLYIEPMQPASPTPIIDQITRKMCAAFRTARRSDYQFGGVHTCCCGAQSSSCDYHLLDGNITNSLCVHYVGHHRTEVPRGHLERIEAFTCGETEPNA